MSEPQSWALIGTFSAAIFGMLTLFSVMLTRVIRAEIGGVRGELGGELNGLRGEMTSEIAGIRGEIAGLEARLTARIDLLDRDIQVIARRVFPEIE